MASCLSNETRDSIYVELGTLIPRFYISLCCFWSIPIAGIIGLIFIRYSQKDKILSRNILITVLIIIVTYFFYPFIQLIVFSLLPCQPCLDSSFELTSDIVVEMLRASVGYMIFGSAVGFLIAYLIVTPITLISRRQKMKKNSVESKTENDC